MTLPAHIKQIFFDTLHGDKSVLEFEQWLYSDKQLENILNSDDYLELISYDFKCYNAKYGLYHLLEKHVDKGEYEKQRILKLLTKALKRDQELPEIFMTFYDLYCKGYNFFDNLGWGYGLAVKVPYSQADSWDELTDEQQQNLLNSFYPDIEKEIKKIISWLDNGTVVLTGIRDEYNHFDYVDNRTELEKQPITFKVTTIDNEKQMGYRQNIADNNIPKPWWKLWQFFVYGDEKLQATGGLAIVGGDKTRTSTLETLLNFGSSSTELDRTAGI